MRFEIQFTVYGNLKIQDNLIEIKRNPYTIKLFEESGKYFISVSKTISNDSDCLPYANFTSTEKEIILPQESHYSDMIELVSHIESFGSLDNKLEFIDKTNITFRWIAEGDSDHFSPLTSITRKVAEGQYLKPISKDWLSSTIIYKNQLGDLFIPFSFFRDGKNLFHSLRYQSAFCMFYMMLEYFFQEKGWGISNDAYKRKKCLRSSLIKTLEDLKKYQKHHDWLRNELSRRGKEYDENGLLFVINIYRNELSHAADKNKNRNVFNEHKYFSLSYVAMMLCLFVSIKKRLLPFVHLSDVESFLDK
jgi:hypothetical protein